MIRNIAINELKTDYSYQRPLDENRAKKIAKDYRPELAGLITVSIR